MQKLYNKTLTAGGSLLLFIVLFAGAAGLSGAFAGERDFFDMGITSPPVALLFVDGIASGMEDPIPPSSTKECSGHSSFLLFFIFNAVAAGSEKLFILIFLCLAFICSNFGSGFNSSLRVSALMPLPLKLYIKLSSIIISLSWEKILRYITRVYNAFPLTLLKGEAGKDCFRNIYPALEKREARVFSF